MPITFVPENAESTGLQGLVALAGLALRPGSVTVVHGATAADTRTALAVLTAPGGCPGRFTVLTGRGLLGSRSRTLPTLVAPLPAVGRFTTVAGYLRRAATAAQHTAPGFGASEVLDRLGLRSMARQHVSQLSVELVSLVEIAAAIVAGVGHRIVLNLQAAALDAISLRRVMEVLADAVREWWAPTTPNGPTPSQSR
jgi:hypothetical protein